MFPWVYGFEWHAGYLIFLGVFFTVAVVVVSTVMLALFRTFRDFRQGRAAQLQWASNFHDLPPQHRACRHALTGELEGRVCEQNFDCRECTMHASLLAKQSSAPACCQESEIFGMPVPLDRYYHRGHTWVQAAEDGSLLIGLDELARRVIGKPDSLTLPAPGTTLVANSPALSLSRNGSEVRILSPVDGAVTAVADPGEDWLLRVKPAGNFSPRHLLSGLEVKAWYLRELERLQLSMGLPEGAPSLADGGVLVEDVASVCPKSQWDTACGDLFLNA